MSAYRDAVHDLLVSGGLGLLVGAVGGGIAWAVLALIHRDHR